MYPSPRNLLHRERDYISEPKESGYRGVHLIFKYNGSKEKYRGLLVELQLRSKIQHSWATAVEVVGTFTKQALKASYGEPIWLQFFQYASVEFAKLEDCPVDTRYEGVDTLKELKECIAVLDIEKRLRAFNVAVKTISSRSGVRGAGYYILLLDLDRRVINLRGFNKSQLEEATNIYNEEEQKYSEDDTKDLVLVSAGSLLELKRAYPNYFSDTNVFSKYLEGVVQG